MSEPTKNCAACRHSYMEPSDMNLVCGHPGSGTFGIYVYRGPAEHCGDFHKFEQHPYRNANGTLKGGR